MFRKLIPLGILFILISFPLHAQEDNTYYPTSSWRTASPEAVGFPADFTSHIDELIDTRAFNGLRSFLVIKDGYIIYEYHYSRSIDTLQGIRSVTKSMTATVVGVALQRGDLESVDVTLADAIPDYFEDTSANPELATITMRDLLMMRSGIEWEDTSSNVLSLRGGNVDHTTRILALPLAEEPGTVWNYSTADAHLVSVMFQHLVGQSLNDYAAAYLFEPLSIENWEWLNSGTDYSSGGAELSLTPRDMGRIGYLYAHDGIWNDEQIISEEWIELVTASQDDPDYYGYSWWILTPEYDGHAVFAAAGYGGQFIYVVPDVDLIVVATNEWMVSEATNDRQYAATRNLIRDEILPLVIELDS